MAKPKVSYNWVLSPLGMICYRDPASFQTVTKLWEASELTPFHDAELAQATKQINAVLTDVEKSNKDPQRNLSFIRFQNQHFLVWARHGVGQLDEDETVIKELRLISE